MQRELIRAANHRFDGGYAAMLELLKLRVRPTAVVASNDLTAIGIMGALYRRRSAGSGRHVGGGL